MNYFWPLNIAIFIYEDAEPLDFTGPFEVFTTANRMAERIGMPSPFRPFLIGITDDLVIARGGFRVMPYCSISDHPGLDVIIVPGGNYEPQLGLEDLQDWIWQRYKDTMVVASVCTGAFILGYAGVLDRKKVITHHEDMDLMKEIFPLAKVQTSSGKRFIDEGGIVTSAGVSAGIDMSLHLVERFTSRELADLTAKNMEWKR